MLRACLGLSLWLVTTAGLAGAGDEAAPIRDFDISTIERLGQDIYERDTYAARATDILFQEVGTEDRLREEKIRGWIVLQRKGGALVRFIRQDGEQLRPAYDVLFSSLEKAKLSRAEGGLTPNELAMFRARELALESVAEPCSQRYNTVVLPDPDGKGFLVYALAATTDPDLILVGGHYRFTVSEDASKVERTDKLSRSCLVLNKRDAGEDLAGFMASHVVSDTPVETHVFLSMSHRVPLFIVTPDGEGWHVENAGIKGLGKVAEPGKVGE